MSDTMLPPDYLNQIVTGDARILAERIPDASVDLIFTDPIYSERPLYDWLGVIARRILKPNGAVLCWSNGKWHRENANWLEAAGLTYRWDFATGRLDQSPLCGKVIASCNRLIWFDIGRESGMIGYLADGYGILSPNAEPMHVRSVLPINPKQHWAKGGAFSSHALKAFSQPGALVFDPFTGGATIPAVCKMLNRTFIAFEIDPDTAQRARARVDATQAMHPVFLEEQTMMATV